MSAETQGPKMALSDEELWAAFVGGEDSAYTLLYYRHGDRLFSYLRLLISNGKERENVDDIFQETWVRVFKGKDKFVENGPGSFSGWLFRIAHNIAISQIRRPKHVTSFRDLSPESSVFRTASVPAYDPMSDERSVEEILKVLHRVVTQLPMSLKEVYILSEFEHLNVDQVAEASGISKGNVKVRLFRARQIVREKVLVELEIDAKEVSSETQNN